MSLAPGGDGPALLAVFARADSLRAALRDVEERGLAFTVFSPTRVDELLEGSASLPPSPVRWCTLAGFAVGAVSGFALCAFTALRWSLVVSGKPVLAWVPFTVVAFELSILLGVLATLGGMLVAGGIPRLRLPAYYNPRFSGDRLGLLVRAGSEATALAARLRDAGAEDVRVVEA